MMKRLKTLLLAGTFVPALLAMQIDAFAGQIVDGSFRVAEGDPLKKELPPGAQKHVKPAEAPQPHVAPKPLTVQEAPVKKPPIEVRPVQNPEVVRKPTVQPRQVEGGEVKKAPLAEIKKPVEPVHPVQNDLVRKPPVQGAEIKKLPEPVHPLVNGQAPKLPPKGQPVLDADGKPLTGKGHKLLTGQGEQPVQGQPPVLGADGKPLTGKGHKPFTGQGEQPVQGQPLLDADGKPLTGKGHKLLNGQGEPPVQGQPLLDADGKPLTGKGHKPLTGQGEQPVQGQPPVLGADGKPLTGKGHKPLIGQGEQPVQGQPPALGADGKPLAGQDVVQQRPVDKNDHKGRDKLLTGAAIGAAAGFFGGMIAASAINARNLNDIRQDRRIYRENGVEFVREPGRTIIDDGGRTFIIHDESERYRQLGLDVRTQRRGDEIFSIVRRPNGEEIVTVTDPDGRLIRRVRRFPDGREYVLIDNGVGGRPVSFADDVIILPPPPLRIPRERFIVDAGDAPPGLIYETLSAPPVAPIQRRYTLDQIRYSPDLRARMRSVDIDTINFDTGSWDVTEDQAQKLETIGAALKKAITRNPNEVFLVEGYTDATGKPTSNISLSDRRAQAVAEILTRNFGVPPENLTTQGYGQQNLKEPTLGPSRINRRVTLRRITPLLAAQGAPAPAPEDNAEQQ